MRFDRLERKACVRCGRVIDGRIHTHIHTHTHVRRRTPSSAPSWRHHNTNQRASATAAHLPHPYSQRCPKQGTRSTSNSAGTRRAPGASSVGWRRASIGCGSAGVWRYGGSVVLFALYWGWCVMVCMYACIFGGRRGGAEAALCTSVKPIRRTHPPKRKPTLLTTGCLPRPARRRGAEPPTARRF